MRSTISIRRPLITCSVVIAALAACLGERGPFTNRMAQSGTSYLARAARQPVRWQPWGRDAFALAAKLDRPLLLYVGSDVCRWCAESDRDIYTNPEIAALINSLFVPVRVDRDERPDIAQRYQAAVEHLIGLRGWPLTVFLTDDGSAFFGGTYFPADDPITGRGLKQLLPEIARSYHDQRASIVQQAARVRQLVRSSNGEARGVLGTTLVQQGLASVRRELADAVRNRVTNGSVKHAQAAALLLSGDAMARAVAQHALELMLDSTASLAGEDPPQLMRAALATTLASAWTVTGDPRYRNVGRSLVQDMTRRLADAKEGSPNEAVFADQHAYVLEHLLLAAGTLGDSAAVRRVTPALEVLLKRTYVRGWGVRHVIARSASTLGLLQDQVQVAAACLAAYQLTAEPRYLDVAIDLAAVMDRAYADSLGGYYDVTDATPNSRPMPGEGTGEGGRTKHVFDDLLPGPNAQAALVLAELAMVTRDPAAGASYRRRARKTLEAFAGAMLNPTEPIRTTTFLAAAQKTLQLR